MSGHVDGVAARRGLCRAADRLVAADAQRQDAEPRARQGVAGLEHRAGRRAARTAPAGRSRPIRTTTWAGVALSLENALLQAPASDRGPKIFVDQRQAFTATGQEYTIRVAAADAALPLRVALSWSDAAGAVGANPALVNDLDLEVRHVDTGQLFRGNVFAGGFSTTGGVADDLNNTEVAVIQNPTGVYEVTVVAANIAASARTDIATPWQDFALVIDNAEVPAADPVSVVTVLDRSGSMQIFGYVDITRQTSRQFIDLMGVDDSIGVVSFGDSGDEEYPGTGAPQQIVGSVDEGCRDRRGRRHRVRRLHLHGRGHPGGGWHARRRGIATRDGAAVGRIRQQGLRRGQPRQAVGGRRRGGAARGPADLQLRDGSGVGSDPARTAGRRHRRPLLLHADDRRPLRDLQLHPRPGDR